MRPRLFLLFVLASCAIASSAYILIKSEKEKITCQKKCADKKPPATQNSGNGDDMFNASFNHLIVSTVK